MNFDATFVHKAMCVVNGGFHMSEAEATKLCALMGSREEFLAWLLLRDNLASKHPEIGEALVAAAGSVVSSAATPRKESGFPIFERKADLAIEAAMKSLIEASESSTKAAKSLNDELDALATYHGRLDLIRYSLGLSEKKD